MFRKNGVKQNIVKQQNYPDDEVLSFVYDIWISGTKLNLNRKQCIQSVEIKETVDGADTATIQILDPEFLFIEDNIFLEENSIKIKMGWSNSTFRLEFSGFISAIDIDFESTGIPKMTITCMDNTHKMNKSKKDRTFNNTTSADIVKKIVQEYGYKCVIDTDYQFAVQETITQSKQTDIDFIQKLAKDEVFPFTARLVGDTFYYVKMGKYETPKMALSYKKFPHDIISFSPKITKETRQEEIKSAEINTSSKELTKAEGKVEQNNGSSSNTASKDAISNNSSGSSSSRGRYLTYRPEKYWTSSSTVDDVWNRNG